MGKIYNWINKQLEKAVEWTEETNYRGSMLAVKLKDKKLRKELRQSNLKSKEEREEEQRKLQE